jgi:hypothetical protein
MILKIEYQKENGDQTVLEGKFLSWHVNKRGEDYITMICFDERDNYRRIHPERIIAIKKSFKQVL